MKAITLSVLVLAAGTMVGQELSRELIDCRALLSQVRPTADEEEKGKQYLKDAEKAYRDCRSSKLPVELRVKSLLKYGIASANLGRQQEAVAVLNEAVALLDRSPQTDAAVLIDVLDTAATTEALAKLHSAATAHAKRALELRQKTYGPTSPEAVSGMVKVAMMYAESNELAKSEALLKDAIGVAKKTCRGPECDALVDAYAGMVALHEMQGNKAEAQRYHELLLNAVPSTRAKE